MNATSIGTAVRRARETRGYTQAELARKAGMNRAQLCAIERGGRTLRDTTLARLAAALGVDASALNPAAPPPSAAAFVPVRRAVGDAPDAPLVKAFDAVGGLEDAHGLPSAAALPLVHAYLAQPHAGEILAVSMRESLHIGFAPVPDLVRTLEFANVRVFCRPLPEGMSSASWWSPARETLLIVVKKGDTPERQLYRLAYEIGAACLFRSNGNKPAAESKRERAFLSSFAAAFLMPAPAVADAVAKAGVGKGNWTLPKLAYFKSYFGVSAEAFAFRLEELGLVRKPLRQKLRTELRRYYAAHPDAMEPPPHLAPLRFGTRTEMLGEG